MAFRLICAGNLPDHVTFARFRAAFRTPPALMAYAVHTQLPDRHIARFLPVVTGPPTWGRMA